MTDNAAMFRQLSPTPDTTDSEAVAQDSVSSELERLDKECEIRANVSAGLQSIGCPTANYQFQLFNEAVARRNSHADIYGLGRRNSESYFGIDENAPDENTPEPSPSNDW